MMEALDRPGIFRAEIAEYGVFEADSGSVGVNIKVRLTEMWDAGNQEWVPWSEYDMEAEGTMWVVKKDGTVNEGAFKSLVEHANWNGDLAEIVNESWRPTPVQVVCNPDSYKDVVRYKVSFINGFDKAPGSKGNVDAEKAKALQAKYGSQFRAIAGNVKRNAAAPVSKPSAPPPKKKLTHTEEGEPVGTVNDNDGVPF